MTCVSSQIIPTSKHQNRIFYNKTILTPMWIWAKTIFLMFGGYMSFDGANDAPVLDF